MQSMPRAWLIALASLSLYLLAASGHRAAAQNSNDKIDSKRVNFPTFDEVELSGTFYRSLPAAGKKDRDAVVLLLHDFRHDKGGSSQEDGWRQLAGQLQREGYAVLSFDFRGFGNSKSVSPKFWKYSHNRLRGSGRGAAAATIDQKNFSASYYVNLVNDIAAARAYLDVLNDGGDVNSSNILIVGAGQGATLGTLWMASECRRQRDPTSDRLMEGLLPDWRNPFKKFSEPEGNDLAAAVWLTLYPMLETKQLGSSLKSDLVDTAKNAKISTYFLYSKDDKHAADFTKNCMDALTFEKGKKIELKSVKEKTIPRAGQLSGSKLLSGRLQTTNYIIDYLNRVVEDRGTRTRRPRDNQKFAFCWSMPWPSARSVHRIMAKLPGEAVPRSLTSSPEVLKTMNLR